jgi:hypothetical protein
MLLTELIKDRIPQYADDAARILRSAGWRQIGSGYHAEVYTKPDANYVIKLFESDRAYLDFLKLVRQHPNKHFPKIKGRVLIDRNIKGVRLEKLTIQQKVQVGDKSFYPSELMDVYLISLRHDLNTVQDKIIKYAQEYLKSNPELQEALALINDKLLYAYSNDIHDENVMMRSDGTPVIIDPVAPSLWG